MFKWFFSFLRLGKITANLVLYKMDIRLMNKILVIALAILPVFAQAQSFKYKNTESGFKNYQGQATLTGKFSRNLDPEYVDYMGDDICFEPNKTSAALIPRPKGDTRDVWFCFSNFDTAKKTFKLPDNIKKGYCQYEGQATIQIKDYHLFIEETEGFDATKLVSASNITPAKEIKCKVQN
jgi:hypothetical protein